MKKILYIAVSSSTGGVPKHILEMLKYNRDNPHYEITVAVPNDGVYYEEFSKYAYQMINVSLKPYNLHSLMVLKNYVSAKGVHIIHSHGKGAGMYARPLKLIVRGVKVVHTFHGLYLEQYNRGVKWIYKIIERCLKCLTDVSICVSESEREAAMDLRFVKSSNCYVIPNGVDPKLFVSNRKFKQRYKDELEVPQDSYTIGAVARLEKMKGHVYLLEAFYEFNKKFPKSHLVLVGDGPDRERVEQTIGRLELQTKVTITGFRQDVPELLQVFDLFVSASLKEGMPYTLLEALAASIPVVATRVIGNQDIIKHKYDGFLVNPEDSYDLFKGMCYAKEHESEAALWAEQGVETINENFTTEQSVVKLLSVYHKLIYV